ncbi:MFS transporter [Microbacterium immunditiarum]|uniref:EmrB/QacA subfamily drug resistance transporter n=1 Tax=Microbacterium immunditiarum TaxID=337480 RepID=A0A7Y9GKP3_9MICO|nr:MFS transporter [Microbacterium immunditiarum]NYE18222.1 EmrB/QacA subfamily drug resistance transporter [Microbacterium immunditiarum]
MSMSPWRLRLLIVSLLTVAILGALDHTIVSTSLATVAGELGALQQMAWVVVGYTLASTILLPILGKLGDAIGPRSVFLVSLVLFLVASLACGFAQDMAQLVAARVVQGMSSAGLHLMSQTIVALVTTPRERPRYLAIVGAAFPVAILVGPVLGGLITDHWGWPWVFWINLPFGVAALVLALVAVPRLPGIGRQRFDIAGAVAFAVAMVVLVLAVTWVGDERMVAASVVLFAVAAMAFAAFFLIELRATEPLVPLRLFANRTIAAGTALSAIIGVGLFSVTAYLPTYFQMAYGTSATVSGLVPIATVFGMLVSNLATGWLVSRTGHFRAYPIAGTALGAAGLLTMSLLPVGLPLWVPMVVMGVVGIGTGAFMSLVVAVVQSAAPRRDMGSITASVNLVRQVGATVTTAVIGGIIGFGVAALLPASLDASTLTPQIVHAADPALRAEIAAIYTQVFAPVFGALAFVYAAGIVAAILLPGGRLSDESEPAAVSSSEPLTA